jgi:hypothetical protein
MTVLLSQHGLRYRSRPINIVWKFAVFSQGGSDIVLALTKKKNSVQNRITWFVCKSNNIPCWPRRKKSVVNRKCHVVTAHFALIIMALLSSSVLGVLSRWPKPWSNSASQSPCDIGGIWSIRKPWQNYQISKHELNCAGEPILWWSVGLRKRKGGKDLRKQALRAVRWSLPSNG